MEESGTRPSSGKLSGKVVAIAAGEAHTLVLTGGAKSVVVTLDSIVIYKSHEWLATKPTVYFHCQRGNKTTLPDVQKEHVLYSFNGEESWQPHGFFNCSPAVDVPPSTCELDSKDADPKENVVTKPIQTPIIAKL